jgi:hypothetical protein
MHAEMVVRPKCTWRRCLKDAADVEPAFLAAEFPAVLDATGLMPPLSAAVRVRSVCVRAVNASLSTDRFAAAH